MLFCWEMLNGWIPYRVSWSKSFLTKGVKGNAFNVYLSKIGYFSIHFIIIIYIPCA